MGREKKEETEKMIWLPTKKHGVTTRGKEKGIRGEEAGKKFIYCFFQSSWWGMARLFSVQGPL